MKYNEIVAGTFLRRPNRFIAHVEIAGQEVICHVKNTGRCRELLVEGCRVYLEKATNLARKTPYDLIAVEKIVDGEVRLINMDAQAPNQIFKEWALAGHFREDLTLLRPETTYGKSRFDFYWEGTDGRRGFVEVKGVTLEMDGHAYFPDAPTQRGIKHIEELMSASQEGYEGALCFVVQMEGISAFSPNDTTHPAFGETLRLAQKAGVQLFALGCHVDTDGLEVAYTVPVDLTAKCQIVRADCIKG